MEHYKSWIILNMLPVIGRVKFNSLINHFQSAQAALEASRKDLEQVKGLQNLAIDSILDWRNKVDIDAELHRIQEHQMQLVALTDPEYPANLKKMHAPPPLLYYKGSIQSVDQAAIAVIGSRRMSRYGREAAIDIASDLAASGVTIVSGLAIGVDSAAHRAAIDAGGRTIACLGNGLSTIYPTQHKRLAEEICEHGAIISEKSMATPVDPGSFPTRNQIIAGLSLGVLVVEAGKRSGTSITASYALEENRTVFAVPGDIGRVNSIGTNKLIRDGATLATSAADILVDLRHELGEILQDLPSIEDDCKSQPMGFTSAKLTEIEQQVFVALEMDPLGIDTLCEMLVGESISQSQLMSTLLNLEVKGFIRQEPGKIFRHIKRK